MVKNFHLALNFSGPLGSDYLKTLPVSGAPFWAIPERASYEEFPFSSRQFWVRLFLYYLGLVSDNGLRPQVCAVVSGLLCDLVVFVFWGFLEYP